MNSYQVSISKRNMDEFSSQGRWFKAYGQGGVYWIFCWNATCKRCGQQSKFQWSFYEKTDAPPVYALETIPLSMLKCESLYCWTTPPKEKRIQTLDINSL